MTYRENANSVRENFHSGYGLLNKIHDDDIHFGTSGALGIGTGGTGGVRQDIGHALRSGFGRNVGNFIGRSTRRRFNRHFQRGHYTGHGYDYECGLPSSYYPSTHVKGWHPYSYHYDPYPFYDDKYDNRNPNTISSLPPTTAVMAAENNSIISINYMWVILLTTIIFFYLLSL